MEGKLWGSAIRMKAAPTTARPTNVTARPIVTDRALTIRRTRRSMRDACASLPAGSCPVIHLEFNDRPGYPRAEDVLSVGVHGRARGKPAGDPVGIQVFTPPRRDGSPSLVRAARRWAGLPRIRHPGDRKNQQDRAVEL